MLKGRYLKFSKLPHPAYGTFAPDESGPNSFFKDFIKCLQVFTEQVCHIES